MRRQGPRYRAGCEGFHQSWLTRSAHSRSVIDGPSISRQMYRRSIYALRVPTPLPCRPSPQGPPMGVIYFISCSQLWLPSRQLPSGACIVSLRFELSELRRLGSNARWLATYRPRYRAEPTAAWLHCHVCVSCLSPLIHAHDKPTRPIRTLPGRALRKSAWHQ